MATLSLSGLTKPSGATPVRHCVDLDAAGRRGRHAGGDAVFGGRRGDALVFGQDEAGGSGFSGNMAKSVMPMLPPGAVVVMVQRRFIRGATEAGT